MADATLKMLLLGEDRSAGRTLRSVGDDAEDTHHRLGDLGDGFGDFAGKVSKVMTVAGAVGPAVMMVGSALSAAAAGAVAIGGAVGPAAVAGLMVYAGGLMAIHQAAGVAKFALKGISEAAAGNEEAMKSLGPEGRSLARTIRGLQPEIESVRRSALRGMFPGVDNAITRLAGSYFPLFRTAARQTGAELGLLAARGAKLADSGPWRRDFADITRKNARNVGLMGSAGLELADATRSVVATGMPVVRMFLQWALGAAKAVNQFVQAKRASGELAQWWRSAATNGAILGNILGNLAVGLFHIFQIGGSGQGRSMLVNISRMSEEFRSWTESEGGRESILRWFARGRQNLAAMGRLLHDLGKGLSDVGSGTQFAPLVDQIRTQVLPPLMEFLHNASASGALNELIGAIGSLMEVLAGLSEHDGSLKSFATTIRRVADAALWVTQNVPGASKALSILFTVAGTSAALKFLGLGGLMRVIGGAASAMATRFLIAAGAANAETGAVTRSSIAHAISSSTIGTWLGVKALEFGAWARSTAAAAASAVATAASTVATRVAAGASKAWAAAQWLLNAALTANPIGLVVAAIALLVAGLVYAYNHSKTFRRIVNAAFHAVADAGKWMWEKVLKPVFSFLVRTWLNVAGWIVNGAAKAFGWVPGIGPKLRAAAAWFNTFKERVNRQLDGIKDKKVDVTAVAHTQGARNAVNQLIQDINGRTAVIHVKTVKGLLDKNAVGRAYYPGGVTQVGERGRPEYVSLPQGSSIRTDDYMRERSIAAGNQGGGGDVYITLITRAPDGREIHRELKRFQRVELGGQPLEIVTAG